MVARAPGNAGEAWRLLGNDDMTDLCSVARPAGTVVIAGQVVVRPMMYVALTYDHRLIDGREAVQFLVTVKQCLEDPARMVLGI